MKSPEDYQYRSQVEGLYFEIVYSVIFRGYSLFLIRV